MPSFLIRDIPDEQMERLRERAKSNHRSLQGEFRQIIREVTSPEPTAIFAKQEAFIAQIKARREEAETKDGAEEKGLSRVHFAEIRKPMNRPPVLREEIYSDD